MRQPTISFSARKRQRDQRTANKAAARTPEAQRKATASPQAAKRAKTLPASGKVGTGRRQVADEDEEEGDGAQEPGTSDVADEFDEADDDIESSIVPKSEADVPDLRVAKTKYTPITREVDIEVHWKKHSKEQKMLRRFDMNSRYGPAVGIPRLDRWNRAKKAGLNPPNDIYDLLTGRDAARDGVKEPLFTKEGL